MRDQNIPPTRRTRRVIPWSHHCARGSASAVRTRPGKGRTGRGAAARSRRAARLHRDTAQPPQTSATTGECRERSRILCRQQNGSPFLCQSQEKNILRIIFKVALKQKVLKTSIQKSLAFLSRVLKMEFGKLVQNILINRMQGVAFQLITIYQ